jgi:uncharacterized membrane-anchored protein YhcB (DUF1043 family)
MQRERDWLNPARRNLNEQRGLLGHFMRSAIALGTWAGSYPMRDKHLARAASDHFGRTKPNSLMKSAEAKLQEACHGTISSAEKT